MQIVEKGKGNLNKEYNSKNSEQRDDQEIF